MTHPKQQTWDPVARRFVHLPCPCPDCDHIRFKRDLMWMGGGLVALALLVVAVCRP